VLTSFPFPTREQTMSGSTTTLTAPRLLTAREVARRYGVQVRTVWRWEKQGQIPHGIRLTKTTVRWREDVIHQHLTSLEPRDRQ
jgi:predicted DNA-binding transcriptional regulator AlpA